MGQKPLPGVWVVCFRDHLQREPTLNLCRRCGRTMIAEPHGDHKAHGGCCLSGGGADRPWFGDLVCFTLPAETLARQVSAFYHTGNSSAPCGTGALHPSIKHNRARLINPNGDTVPEV